MFHKKYQKTQKYDLKIALKGGLYSQVVKSQHSIQKTKVTNEPLLED